MKHLSQAYQKYIDPLTHQTGDHCTNDLTYTPRNTSLNPRAATGIHLWCADPNDKRPLLLIWWRHQMETFSALLAIFERGIDRFPAQRPVTRSVGVFLDLRLNKWLSKQSWGWWFEMPSRPLWRHCNDRFTTPASNLGDGYTPGNPHSSLWLSDYNTRRILV